MQDTAIVDLYWQRNEQAIKETELKYGNYLFKIADNILSDREDSKECVNDTYLKAWNTMPPHRPKTLSIFLGKITRFVSIDKYRKRTSLKRKSSEYALVLDEIKECEFSSDMIEEKVNQIVLTELIQDFLMKLPPDTRNVFIGRYFYMDSIKNIAKNTNSSESNVKIKLYRTRMALKEFLMEQDGIQW